MRDYLDTNVKLNQSMAISPHQAGNNGGGLGILSPLKEINPS